MTSEYSIKVGKHSEIAGPPVPIWCGDIKKGSAGAVIRVYAEGLDDDFDIDAFKTFCLKKLGNPDWKPNADRAQKLSARSAASRDSEKRKLGDYDRVDYDRLPKIADAKESDFDVQLLLQILRHPRTRRVHETLLARFDNTKLAGLETFSLKTFLDTSEWTIWYDRTHKQYRDAVSGETELIGYCTKMTNAFIINHSDDGQETSYAEERAKNARALTLAALALDAKAWLPGSGEHKLYKGLKPEWVESAGIRFCNQAPGSGGREEFEDTDMGSVGSPSPDSEDQGRAKKPRKGVEPKEKGRAESSGGAGGRKESARSTRGSKRDQEELAGGMKQMKLGSGSGSGGSGRSRR